MLCVIFFFDLWRNGFRNVHFLMASIENHPFDLLIHKEKCLQGYTLRLEAIFKESGRVHQSTTTPTNLRPWTVLQSQHFGSLSISQRIWLKLNNLEVTIKSSHGKRFVTYTASISAMNHWPPFQFKRDISHFVCHLVSKLVQNVQSWSCNNAGTSRQCEFS